jgi:uncharacterized protein
MSDTAAVSTTEPKLKMMPVQPKERITIVDILRGFSLIGVLMMNMHVFAGDFADYNTLGTIDRAAWFFTRFFAQAKFYTLFSFLFGWGMSIQMRRADERGAGFVGVYVRRLLMLLLIGLVHTVLIWSGDILVTYALLGFFLILFRKRSDTLILITVVICLLIPVIISTPGPVEPFMDAYNEWLEPLRAPVMADRQAGIYADGTYGEFVAHRLLELRSGLAGFVYWATHILGMFLLGLFVGRRKILANASDNLPLFRKVMWIGFAIGLPLNYLWVATTAGLINVPAQYNALAVRGARTIAGSSLSMAYASTLILLLQKRDWQNLLSPLAYVGRTALSNYLMHSVVFTLVFYPYGLGFFGETGPAVGLILTLVFFRIQISLSRWWLDRYQYGPMEWVWRSMTYGKPQSMISEHRRRARAAIDKWSVEG